MSTVFDRMRDTLGRFLPATTPVIEESIVETPEADKLQLVTDLSVEITINGKPIDFTNISKEEAVVLFNFGHLRPEHFRALCQLEGWRFDEELEFEEEDEDEDDDQ